MMRSSAFHTSGGEFFRSLGSALHEEFNTYAVLVGELASDGSSVSSRLWLIEGEPAGPLAYQLEGTPCEKVVHPPSVCVHPRGVSTLFPQDTWLAQVNACGYAGIPLFDSEPRLIGNLAVITREPIADPETMSTVLQLFGHRTALELEHLRRGEAASRKADAQLDA